MRLATGTRVGVFLLLSTWTLMASSVVVALFLHTPKVTESVDAFSRVAQAAADILVIEAMEPHVVSQEDRIRQFAAWSVLSEAATARSSNADLAAIADAIPLAQEGDGIARALVAKGVRKLAREAANGIAVIRPTPWTMWPPVVLAALGMLIAVVLIRLLVNRLLIPVEELYHYFDATRSQRVLLRIEEMPAVRELSVIMGALNRIVDSRMKYAQSRRLNVPMDEQAAATGMMERILHPVWVVAADGDLVAANARALDVLASDVGTLVRAQLSDLADLCRDLDTGDGRDGESVPTGWEVDIVGDGEAIVCIMMPSFPRAKGA